MTLNFDSRGNNFKWLVYIVDIIILSVVFSIFVNYVVEVMGWRNYDGDSRFYWNRYGHLLVFILSYAASVAIIKIKPSDLDSMLETFIKAGFQVGLMYVIFTLSVAIFFHTFPGHLLMWSGIVNGILICLSHCIITKILVTRRRRNVVNVVFVGADENNVRLYDEIKQGYSTFSYSVSGFFTSTLESNVPADSKCLGKISGVCDYLAENKVGTVLCSLNPAKSEEDISHIIQFCENNFISFYFVPNMEGYPHRRMHFGRWGDVTVISLHNEPLADPYKRVFKRIFDIFFSGLFLITLFPLIFIFVAIGTKLSSPGPIFFRQRRTGYNGHSFTMLKFRSMRVNADSDRIQATADDPRKTRFGDFLRRTSIDELPQFINVFKGDMSVVGPRPHMELQTKQYSELIDGCLVRHLCKPGLTGWAQISGCRGETKTVSDMAERVRHDIWYIENWSMLLDLRIILKTVLQLFKGDENAY